MGAHGYITGETTLLFFLNWLVQVKWQFAGSRVLILIHSLFSFSISYIDYLPSKGQFLTIHSKEEVNIVVHRIFLSSLVDGSSVFNSCVSSWLEVHGMPPFYYPFFIFP